MVCQVISRLSQGGYDREYVRSKTTAVRKAKSLVTRLAKANAKWRKRKGGGVAMSTHVSIRCNERLYARCDWKHGRASCKVVGRER